MTKPIRVAIIGGGIGGLGAANALSQAGHTVSVYEQAPELKEIGAGLDLTPNAMRVMRSIGLEDACRAIGWQPEFRVWRHWKTGMPITRIAHAEVLDRYGAAGCHMHRADLLDVLANALPGSVDVTLNAACVSVENEGEIARAKFRDGSEIEADVVIGADGIRSAVRTTLFGESAPRFTGKTCYRTVIPVDALPDGVAIRDSGNSRGPHGLFVIYGVRRGELINVVCHYDDDGFKAESWNTMCPKEEVLERYSEWHESYLRVFDATTEWYKWPLYDRDPISAWSVGRISLLGDAAHPMLPYLGQGAAQALEDGVVLARALGALPDDIPGALKAYEGVRIPRTSRMVFAARARAEVNHTPSPFAAWKRDRMIALRKRFSSDPGGRGDSWVVDYDATDPDVLTKAS